MRNWAGIDSIEDDWRLEGKRYSMSRRVSAGLTPAMRLAVELAAKRLSKKVGRRVSMSEVIRRLIALGDL